MSADLTGERAELYARFDEEAPEIASKRSSWERIAPLGGRQDIVLVFSLSQDKSSVYMKGTTAEATSWIERHRGALAKSLRVAEGRGSGEAAKGYWFRKDNPRACFTIRSQWPEIIRWFRSNHASFDKAVRDLEDVT